MENPIKNVDLSFSCPEKWENMVDIGSNKYCESCKHLVVDFTKLSQHELEHAVKNAPGRICGRFKSSQMSPRFLKYAAVSAMAASVLTPISCLTEEPLPADLTTEPPIEQVTDALEYGLIGIVFIPDSLMHETDTTLLEEPFDEGKYFPTE